MDSDQVMHRGLETVHCDCEVCPADTHLSRRSDYWEKTSSCAPDCVQRCHVTHIPCLQGSVQEIAGRKKSTTADSGFFPQIFVWLLSGPFLLSFSFDARFFYEE
jgi:hypothetical protein